MRAPALASLALLAACAVGDPAVQRGAIVGGTRNTGDPGVVLLYGQRASSNEGSLCTAEVISPHVALTAAHCVSPQVVGSGLSFSLFLGDDLNDGSQHTQSNFVAVSEVHYHPDFDVDHLDRGGDIAVVVTGAVIPVTPLLVNQDPIDSADVGSMLRLVGYGLTSSSAQNSSGVKRQVSTQLKYADDLFLAFGDSSHNTCEGDSGGPAFMTRGGKEVIVGVTSFGDEDCLQGGVDTRVDTFWSSFVAPALQAADGTVPPNPSAPPPDMAMPPSTPSTPTPAKGTVGAACAAANECNSGICTTGEDRYCTQACDPDVATSCPDGSHCGEIGGARYCVVSDGGCSASPGSLASRRLGSDGALLGLFLGGLFFLVRVRRRRV